MAPSRWLTGPQIAFFVLCLISLTCAFEVPILDTGSFVHASQYHDNNVWDRDHL